MTKTCLICKSESTPFQKRSFHIFPSGESARNRWIESLKLSNKTINFKTASICSDHFDEKSFFYHDELRRRSRLRSDAVPQLTKTKKPSINIVSVDNSQKSNALKDASAAANLNEGTNVCTDEMTYPDDPDFEESDALKDISLQANVDNNAEMCTFYSTDEMCSENCNKDFSNLNSQTINYPSNSKNRKNLSTDVKSTRKVFFMTGFKTEYMCREDFSNEEAWNKFLRYSSYHKSETTAAHNNILSTIKSEPKEKTCLKHFKIQSPHCEIVTPIDFVTIKKEVEDIHNIKTELLHEEYDFPSIKTEELDWTQELSYSDIKPENLCSDIQPENSKKVITKNKNYIMRKYSCVVCSKGFTKATTRKKHLNVHFKKKLVTCFFCGRYFSDKIFFLNHWHQHFVKKRTVENSFKCKISLKRLSQKSILINHMRYHTSEKPFKCEICLKQFLNEKNLKRHKRVHTGEKPFKCEICLKYFSRKNNLIKHMRIHTGEKPFKCDICLRQFSDKSTLRNHFRIHTGEKPAKCDICLKQFSHNSCLRRHMRVHTGEKPFKCDICLKHFSDKSCLRRHMHLHTGEKPFQCDICLKQFSNQSCFRRHMRIHTDEKPFQCDICLKQLWKKTDLTEHMRFHTGEKPFQCEVCLREFSNKSSFRRHLRTHTGERSFTCTVCLKQLSDESYLRKHMRIHTG